MAGPESGDAPGAGCPSGGGTRPLGPHLCAERGISTPPRSAPPAGEGQALTGESRSAPLTRKTLGPHPAPFSGFEPGSLCPHRDEWLPPVLLFQGAQLCGGQQGQSQLPHYRGSYLGHRPLQHRLRTPALSPGGRGHLAHRPLAGFLRPDPSAPSALAPLRRPPSALTAPTRAQLLAARMRSASSMQSLSLRSRGSNAGADSSRKPRVRRASCGSKNGVTGEQEVCEIV